MAGLIDRGKVIKGLECCIKRDPDDKTRCEECPYEGACLNRLKSDALALLKAQEPRVMTLEELSGIYVEFKNYLIPMRLINFDLGKIICSMLDGSCRLWTTKPSVEQREAAAWE